MDFEWDEAKRQLLLTSRGLDLADGDLFFDGRDVVTMPTRRDEEPRWKTTAFIEGRFYTLVWTWRGEGVIRLISMRRAWNAEERQYRALHG